MRVFVPPPPIAIGPTWRERPDWNGVDPADRFVLPELTLGYQVIHWAEANLLSDASNDASGEIPWRFTAEQARFVLWWYAVDERGQWLFRDGVLQRVKGWGKDPLLAVLCAVEMLGPCRFGGWATGDMPDLGLLQGDPVAIEEPNAYIQVAAVSRDQSRNTMLLFQSVFSARLKVRYRIQVKTNIVTALGGRRQIIAVTSNPPALEGKRPTMVLRNEVQHWSDAVDGIELGKVIARNLAKSKGGLARALSITNAYDPAQGSWGQKQREAWEAEESGESPIRTGLLYDSLEVGHTVDFTPPIPKGEPPATEAETRGWLADVFLTVRGDATWLLPERVVDTMLDPITTRSESVRFYWNQIESAADAWIDDAAVKAARHPEMVLYRRRAPDGLRAGWTLVGKREPIVVFGDGSKSQDATGLVGARVSDAYSFTLGIWARPSNLREKDAWLVPREDVSTRVDEIFSRFTVLAFWYDPSHARDDEEQRYWDSFCDRWHRDHGQVLPKQHWAVKTGENQHSIMWDMTSPERIKLFTAGAERTAEDLETRNELEEEFRPRFLHDGHQALMAHVRNARLAPNRWGTSIRKEAKGSVKKIDLGVCLAGAQMLRRQVLNIPEVDKPSGAGWVRMPSRRPPVRRLPSRIGR